MPQVWPQIRPARARAIRHAACNSLGELSSEETMATKTPRNQARSIVTLADLAPRREVMGGSQRRVFGASTDNAADSTVGPGSSKKLKDLAPKSGAVKGGKLAVNDAMTLVRAAKPTVKDLPPRQDVKGGKKAV